jgi:hypothetical protein
MLRMIAQLRSSAVDAYGSYLQKVAKFEGGTRPTVGDKWPREGNYLPDMETFRKAVETANSTRTLNGVLAAVSAAPVEVKK